MTRDRGIGIFSVILGALVAFETTRIPASQMANDVGPKVFPGIASVILIACGIILIVRRNAPPPRPFLTGKAEVIRFLAIIGVIIAYVVGLWALGYIIPTIAMVTGLCMMFGKEKKVPIWIALIYGAAITFIIYGIFTYALHLRMPVSNLF